ncbi:MAG: hypothetical protein P8O86_13295 [Actinomycetota bacterium]|nr:hypothetical protein [Actinomycetota bacterium]MDG2119734.1 hypothetical protein [Actinomycetota bacterium]
MKSGPTVDAATVLLQWSTGGLFFLWVTTRRREVGLGYGWLMRSTYIVIAVLGAFAGFGWSRQTLRDVFLVALVVSTSAVLVASIARRKGGVTYQTEENDRRSERVAQMTGIQKETNTVDLDVSEFNPQWDLLAPAIGFVGLCTTGFAGNGNLVLEIVRLAVGAAFLGVVTDAMLLGHWYLVQPGLRRDPLLEQVSWLGRIWPLEIAALLIPTGMISVLSGEIDDGYGGMLGWFWAACALTTLVLTGVTRLALRERQYAAVMAATGLLYLAILTAFGTDIVGRLVLEK